MAAHTFEQLEGATRAELMQLVLDTERDNAKLMAQVSSLDSQIKSLTEKIDYLVEQIRVSDAYRFGRKTEKLSEIDGQMHLFNECEDIYQEDAAEPSIEDAVPKPPRKAKQKGQRKLDLSELPHELCDHRIDRAKADAFFGKGCYRLFKTEEYMRLRFQPATWLVEDHLVEVCVGTDGDHQDEFMRADHPKSLLRNSIVTPSLEAAVMNGKYVNAMPLYRIEQELSRNGISISRQTMANWTIRCASLYFRPVWDRMKESLLSMHVTQADETPVRVLNTGEENRSNCYMWVHRSGEFYKDRQIVLYEYQNSRHHKHPEAFYKGYEGILVTDGLNQHHMLEGLIPGLTSANCWAHARRDFSDAMKAGRGRAPDDPRSTIAYEALVRIASIYKTEEGLKSLPSKERLERRKDAIAPLVDEFFAWLRRMKSDGGLIKSKTLSGIDYCLNQEKYLRVFLTDGDVPIDNSASLSEAFTYPHLSTVRHSGIGFSKKDADNSLYLTPHLRASSSSSFHNGSSL